MTRRQTRHEATKKTTKPAGLLPPPRPSGRRPTMSDKEVLAGVITSLIAEGYDRAQALEKLQVMGARRLLATRQQEQRAAERLAKEGPTDGSSTAGTNGGTVDTQSGGDDAGDDT